MNEYLGHHDWEAALDILMELGDVYRAETSFWDLCAQAAHCMQGRQSRAMVSLASV